MTLKTRKPLPSLFLPHGAPDLAIAKNEASDYLKGLREKLPPFKGIVIISAHWETDGLYATSGPELETIYDFGGFPDELRQIRYSARTAPWLLEDLQDRLSNAGYSLNLDERRGLDHGAWVPLSLALPKADIPVVALSLDRSMSPDALMALGRALAPLREQGILIAGSGGLVHNLHEVDYRGNRVPDWAREFDKWLDEKLQAGAFDELAKYRKLAPNAERAHPSDEHLLPLFVALGAAGETVQPEKWHASFTYGSISMSSWAFL